MYRLTLVSELPYHKHNESERTELWAVVSKPAAGTAAESPTGCTTSFIAYTRNPSEHKPIRLYFEPKC